MKRLLSYFLISTCIAFGCRKPKVVPAPTVYSTNISKTGLKKDEDVNEIDEFGFTRLYNAVTSNDVQEVRCLLELGSDPNIGPKDNYPLDVAVRKRNKEMVALLLSRGAKIIFQEDGRSKVLDYVRHEKDDASKEIYALLVSNLSPEGATRSDLEWRKDINETKNGSTLLLRAVRKNNLDEAEKFLKLGANPNIANVNSNPLEVAVGNKNKEMVSLLLSYGAEVIFRENGQSDILSSLEVDNNQEILSVILCHFASKGKQDSVSLSPIHWSCRDGHLGVVKYLLEKDPSLVYNSDNPYKFTPLHWASRRGFKEIVELLISKGANKKAMSKSGFTPLMLAISNKHEELKSILSPDGFLRHSKLVYQNWTCSVCLTNATDADNNRFPFIPLDCGHKFHFRCITQNVLTQHRNDQPITCPNCRGNISEDMFQKIASNYVFTSPFSVLDAVSKKDMPRLRSLLEKGGNVNEENVPGSPLQEAVCQSSYEMVSLLLEYGADPNYLNPASFNTPLHYAADNMAYKRTSQDVSDKIFIALIKEGALINRKNANRETPRDRAYSYVDPRAILPEAGGIRSGYSEDIQLAFGLSGSKTRQKILFGKELPPHTYDAKL